MQDVNNELITMQEAATRLCVTTQTVRTWGRMGLIRLIRLPRGMFRVPRSEVDRVLAEGSTTSRSTETPDVNENSNGDLGQQRSGIGGQQTQCTAVSS